MKIRYKIILTIIAISLLAAVPLSFFILQKQKSEKLSNTKDIGLVNSQIMARSAIDVVIKNPGVDDIISAGLDTNEMLQGFKDLKKLGMVRAEVLRLDPKKRKKLNGLIMGTWSGDDSGQEGNPVADSETLTGYLEALGDSRTAIRETACGQARCYEFLAMGVYQDKLKLSLARLLVSKDYVLKPIEQSQLFIIIAAAVAVIVSVAIGYIVSNFITRPVHVLTEGVVKYGDGDFDARVEVSTKDEIGVLASTFNTMAGDLKEKIEEIEDHRDNLEVKVQERTRELNTALEEVSALKEQQDGDYFLCSLLLKPLSKNANSSERIKTDFYIEEKKKSVFRGKHVELGGDLCISGNLNFRINTTSGTEIKTHIFIANGDAMGKSIQGGSGAIVFGTVIQSILSRKGGIESAIPITPEKWLEDVYWELQKIFLSFDYSMLMSCVCALICEESGKMYYFNAEHPWTVVYRDGQAMFIEDKLELRKLGHESYEYKFKVKNFQLHHDDILYIGSDGRDDLELDNPDNSPGRNILSDETEFLTRVEESEGDLQKLYEAIVRRGKLTDDFSLIRVHYNADVPARKVELVHEQLNRAKELLKDKKVDEARAVLENIGDAEMSMKSSMYHFLWGRIYNYKNNADKAIISLQRAIELGLQSSILFKMLGNQYYRQKNYEQALSFWNQALEISPDDQRLIETVEKVKKLLSNENARPATMT